MKYAKNFPVVCSLRLKFDHYLCWSEQITENSTCKGGGIQLNPDMDPRLRVVMYNYRITADATLVNTWLH